MTSYTLLQFPDRLVLCSDEMPVIGGYLCAYRILQKHGEDAIAFADEEQLQAMKEENIPAWKVIAGYDSIPSVDVTAIAETIGWVDVRLLAKDHSQKEWPDPELRISQGVTYCEEDFIAGFHKAQELNKNKFTEEDMIEAWESGAKGNALDLMSKQHPKQWRVEVDMIDNFPGTGERIRITNNTIKVTKVVEQ